MKYDVIVIGAGPAGWSAALQGSKLGLNVAVIEKSIVGGACVHTGTVPSKTLRETILDLMAVRRRADLGLQATFVRPLSIQDLMGRKNAVIQNQVRTLQHFLDRNHVQLISGSARIASPGVVIVATTQQEQRLQADHIVIATGSRPRRPDMIPFDDRSVCDSDSILSLDAIPRSLTVLGGGVIGCEYACMFAALGVKVSLIDRRTRLMRFLDDGIVDSLYYHMRAMGIRIMEGEELKGLTVEPSRRGSNVVVELKSGRRVKSDRLLAAAGRDSNTVALGLENVGIETDETGLIKVDESYRTTQAGIYAVGDVIGFPALAGTSMHQGRLAVLSAAGKTAPPVKDLPIAIYTIPEISAVGLTESQCREAGIVYEIGVARYSEIPRGQIRSCSDGLLKLVFRRDDRVLLGVHLIGEDSSELVHLGAMLVHHGGSIDQLVDTVFNYPTLSEAYRVAALDGLNRL